MPRLFVAACVLVGLAAAPARAEEGLGEAAKALDPAAMSQVNEFKQQLSEIKKPGPQDMGKVQKLLKIAMALKAGNGQLKPEDLQVLRESLHGMIGNAEDPTMAQLLVQLDAALARLEVSLNDPDGSMLLPGE